MLIKEYFKNKPQISVKRLFELRWVVLRECKTFILTITFDPEQVGSVFCESSLSPENEC